MRGASHRGSFRSLKKCVVVSAGQLRVIDGFALTSLAPFGFVERGWRSKSGMLILSDDSATGDKLRQVLGRAGHECPAEHVLSLENAASTLALQSDGAAAVVIALRQSSAAALRLLQQIRVLTNGVIIAVGPKDAELILYSVRCGVDDYVDENRLEDELPRAIARQAAARVAPTQEGQLTLIAAGGGGCGRSQIATNLSVLLARSLGKSALVELDTVSGNCASMLSLKPRHTVLDLCRHADKFDRKTLDKTLVAHECGVNLLAGPLELARPDALRPEFMERLVRELRTMFPRVIVDFQDLWNAELLRKLAALSAQVLLVTRLDFNSVCNTGRALDHLDRLGVDRQRVKIVVNRYGEPGDVSARKIEQTLAIKIEHLLPDDPQTVHRSVNSGIPYVIDAPASALSKALNLLAVSLSGAPAQASTVAQLDKSALADQAGRQPARLPDFRSLWSRMTSALANS